MIWHATWRFGLALAWELWRRVIVPGGMVLGAATALVVMVMTEGR